MPPLPLAATTATADTDTVAANTTTVAAATSLHANGNSPFNMNCVYQNNFISDKALKKQILRKKIIAVRLHTVFLSFRKIFVLTSVRLMYLFMKSEVTATTEPSMELGELKSLKDFSAKEWEKEYEVRLENCFEDFF